MYKFAFALYKYTIMGEKEKRLLAIKKIIRTMKIGTQKSYYQRW